VSQCPKCGSTCFVDSVRLESCDACGYYFCYPDATAPPDAPDRLPYHHEEWADEPEE
jgi:hypothetical protein